MQQTGGATRPGRGSGSAAAGRTWTLRSLSARAGRRMGLVDDIWVRMFRQSAIPERTGPHAVGTAKLKVRAASDGRKLRAIVVQLWYPADGRAPSIPTRGRSWLAKLLHPTWAPALHGAPLAVAKGAFPFIAYVHDAQGHYDDNTFTLANLASHGFILAAIKYPYGTIKDDVDETDSKAAHSANGVNDPLTAHYERVVARGVETASALLDALLMLDPDGAGGAWAGRLDLRQVGILGYATGGAVAAETALADPRYTVAANLDGSICGKARVVPGPYLMMLSDFSMPAPRSAPCAVAGASDTPSRLGDYRRAQRQAALNESHIIEVAGTRREHFSDKLTYPSRLFAGYRQLPRCRRIRAIIDSYTVAFFTTYLDGEPHPLMCVRHSPYPEVRFVSGTDENGGWALREPAGRG